MHVETKCKKCGTTINLDVTGMTLEEAKQKWKEFGDTPRECPGFHVELSGMYELWGIEDALNYAFDKQSFKQIDIPTDYEYVKELLNRGCEVIDGGSNKVPELNLPSIHDFKNLQHIGFGEFTSNEFDFIRKDSPMGTRFYLKYSKSLTS